MPAEDEAKEVTKSSGPVEKGDIITIEYDAWIRNPDGTEELFDTTDEEHAKAGEIYDEKAKYTPITTVAGDGRVLAGLDNSFLTAKVGEKSTVEIPPSDGAGERLPNMVEIHSIRELQKQKIEPEIGLRVQIKNKMGTIIAVTSGRVRIDFNDPLAGKTIKYEYKVLKKAETLEEKVLGLIEADYGKSEEFEAHIDGDALEMYLPDICKYDQVWFTLKYKVVSDLREQLDFKTIRFVEEYVKKEEDEADSGESEKDAAPEETKAEDTEASAESSAEEPAAGELEESAETSPEETEPEEQGPAESPTEEIEDEEEPVGSHPEEETEVEGSPE